MRLFFKNVVVAVCAAALTMPSFAGDAVPPFAAHAPQGGVNSITYSDYRIYGGALPPLYRNPDAAPPFRRDEAYVAPGGILSGILSSNIGSFIVVGAIVAGGVKAADNYKKAEERRRAERVAPPDDGAPGDETPEPCPAERPIRDGDSCRMRNQAECEAGGRIFLNRDEDGDGELDPTGRCVCPGHLPIDEGEAGCRAWDETECEEAGFTYSGGICFSRTYCKSIKMRLNDAGGSCRAITENDCALDGMTLGEDADGDPNCVEQTDPTACIGDYRFNTESESCRPPTQEQCEEGGETLSEDGRSCVAVSATSCEARNMRMAEGGSRCRALTAADCRADGFVLIELPGILGAGRFSCDTPNRAQCESLGGTYVAAEEACRPATPAECAARVQIVGENGFCRAGTTQTECEDAGLAFDAGACRTPTEAECEDRNQILANGFCNDVADGECVKEGYVVENDNCVPPPPPPSPTAESCAAQNQILDGNSCRAGRNQAECGGINQIYYAASGDTPGGCRHGINEEDCLTINKFYDAANSACRAPTAEECAAQGQILDGSSCRTPTAAECMADNRVLENGRCVFPLARTCRVENKLVSSDGTGCVDRCGENEIAPDGISCELADSAEDCRRYFRKVYDAGIGTCRAPATDAECQVNTINEFMLGGICVPPNAEVCAARNEIFANNACRAGANAAECAGLRKVYDGTISGCRAPATDAECHANTANSVMEGDICVPPNTARCAARGQIFASGACRAGTAAEECEDIGRTFDTNACRTPTDEECRNRGATLYGGICQTREELANFGLSINELCRSRHQKTTTRVNAENKTEVFCEPGENAEECETIGLTFDSAAGGCRAPTDSECRSRNAVLVGDSCRVPSHQSCLQINQLFDGNTCRPLAASPEDCSRIAAVYDAGGFCRPGRSAAECETAGLRFTGSECRAPTAEECTADNQILELGACRAGENTGECVMLGQTFDAGINGCRPPANAADCENEGLQFTAGKCRAPTLLECVARRQILEMGGCRAGENIQECSFVHSIYDTDMNACRAPANHAECTSIDRALDGDNCVPATDEICARTNQVRDGHVCATATDEVCARRQQVKDGNRCATVPLAEFCARMNNVLEGRFCRTGRTAMECENIGKTFDSTTNACRAPTAMECTARSMILAGESCTTASMSACTARHEILDGTSCRAGANTGECEGIGKIFDSAASACRAPTAAECESEGLQFTELMGGACRASSMEECTAANQILDGDACRAGADAGECEGIGKIFDSAANACRAPTAADCENAGLQFTGSACRASTMEECTAANQILDGDACRAGESTAECAGIGLIFANNACRAGATQTECENAGLQFTGSACRASTMEECTANNQILENGFCRAGANAGECEGIGKTFDAAANACRTPTLDECVSRNRGLSGNSCVSIGNKPTEEGCALQGLVLAATGIQFQPFSCRAPENAEDCGRIGLVYDNGACREGTTQMECESAGLQFANGACRASTLAECAADNQILHGRACRAGRSAIECNAIGLAWDEGGGCRKPTRAECEANINLFGKPAYSNGFFTFQSIESYRRTTNRLWFLVRADGSATPQTEAVNTEFTGAGSGLPTFQIDGTTVTLQAGDAAILGVPGTHVVVGQFASPPEDAVEGATVKITEYRRAYNRRAKNGEVSLVFSLKENRILNPVLGAPSDSSPQLRCTADSAMIDGQRHKFRFMDENWMLVSGYNKGRGKSEFPLRQEITGGLLGHAGLRAGGFSFSGDSLQDSMHAEYHSSSAEEAESALETNIYLGYRKADGGRTKLYYHRAAAAYKLSETSRIFARTTAGRVRSQIYEDSMMYDFSVGLSFRDLFRRDDSYHVLLESPFRAPTEAVWRIRAGANITEHWELGVYRGLESESGVQLNYRQRF